MTDETREPRLPPPAFPPGKRRRHVLSEAEGVAAPKGSSADGAADRGIISPDDPLPPRADPLASALISPDEPLPERFRDELDGERAGGAHAGAGSGEAARVDDSTGDDFEGEAVGMDLDAHHEAHEAMAAEDPYLAEVVRAVANLAEGLRRRGPVALHATPGMTRFEATLRAYCVGYLAGRRAEPANPPGGEED